MNGVQAGSKVGNVSADDLDAFEAEPQTLAERVSADDSFACELYAALCNMRWQRKDMQSPVSVSWRYAGGVVAQLVDEDGCYLDFYCSGNEGKVSERVRVALGGLGWMPVPWPD
jgi:hypothetical protein